MSQINVSCRIDQLSSLGNFRNEVDVLRLDLLHPVVSGNKWFKLKEYLKEAKQLQKTILTFGGAYSNHIVATAAAAKNEGLKSIGIIRGEEAPVLSHTLVQARELGMKLYFIDRETYKSKIVPESVYLDHLPDNLYIIPEGGYGEKGMEGAKDILLQHNTSAYTHIVSAVGTGTTVAGLTAAASLEQKIIGVSALKNNLSLEEEIRQLLPLSKHTQFQLFHQYHFGGYAKHTKELIQFMNDFFFKTGIPTDFIYTGKAFFAAFDLLQQDYFAAADKILLVHTGGLQGNLSLPKGTLIFG